MIVNFDFYLIKLDKKDSDYRLSLTTYEQNTYNTTLLKEGILYFSDKTVLRDLVDLDLPINEDNRINNWFNIKISLCDKTTLNATLSDIPLDIFMLKVNNNKVKNYVKKYCRIAHSNQTQPCHYTLEINAAIIKQQDSFVITNVLNDYHSNNYFWESNNLPFELINNV